MYAPIMRMVYENGVFMSFWYVYFDNHMTILFYTQMIQPKWTGIQSRYAPAFAKQHIINDHEDN